MACAFRPFAAASLIAAVLLLQACRDEADEPMAVSGSTLASMPASSVPPDEAVLSFRDAEGAVRQREIRAMPDRYSEIARLGAGYVRYQRLYGTSFGRGHDHAAAAALAYEDEWFAEQRFARPGRWRQAATAMGPLAWAPVNGTGWRCVIFGQVFGEGRFAGSEGDRELRGINCRPLDDPRVQALEAETLNLLERLRLRS